MRIHTTGMLAAALLIAGAACKKDESKPADKGTAKATGAPDKAKPTPDKTAPDKARAKPTGEQVAAWYRQCWDHFNGGKFDEFRTCFADDMVSEEIDSGQPPTKGADAQIEKAKAYKTAFPDMKGDHQLTLVHGDWVVGVTLLTGTHDGVMKTPMGDVPATGKKIGLLAAHVIRADDAGKAVEERFYMDSTAMMGQLGLLPAGVPFRAFSDAAWPQKPVVIAAASETEAKNLAAYEAQIAAFNAHDLDKLGAGSADDLVWSEQAMPADQDKKAMLDGLALFWKGFSDMKLTSTETFAAGDYVVAMGTMTATNDGAFPEMGLKEATGKQVSVRFLEVARYNKDGKQDRGWLFMNGMALPMQLGLMPPPGAPPPAK